MFYNYKYNYLQASTNKYYLWKVFMCQAWAKKPSLGKRSCQLNKHYYKKFYVIAKWNIIVHQNYGITNTTLPIDMVIICSILTKEKVGT